MFGVTDVRRQIVGVGDADFPDEAVFQDFLEKHLFPCPYFSVYVAEIENRKVIILHIEKQSKPPVIARCDCQTTTKKNKTVLTKGVIYTRRSGQSRPCSAEEYHHLLEQRDSTVRNEILSLFDRARKIGFEHVAIADFSNYAKPADNVTLYLPEEAARHVNVVDRAKLVEDAGAPAYEIKGNVELTSFSKKDPRKPLLPEQAARSIKGEIERLFWKNIPWTAQHLRRVSKHLGFWDKPEGDDKHTSLEPLTNSSRYLEKGRLAIVDYARNSPDEFIDTMGSRATRSRWRQNPK